MAVTINADNGVSSGSAGLKQTADSTGVLALQTNGTTAVTVDASQNVGIGTSSPAYKLDVSATSFIAASVSTSYSGAGNIRIADASTTSGSAPYIGSVGNNLTFGRIGTAEYMRIDSSGNVGIGTSSPAVKLHVSGGTQRIQSTGSTSNAFLTLQNDVGTQAILGIVSSGNSPANNFFIETNGGKTVYVTSTGLFQFNNGYGSAATAYGCRAWVNFNGTGTVAIRASGNVTSITDNGVGNYTVNFTNAMPDANYGIAITAGGANSGAGTKFWGNVSNLTDSTPPTTTTMQFLVGYSDTTTADCSRIQVAIFR